jgi:phage baseplate assembly protein gpV
MDEHDEDGAVFGSIFSSTDTTPNGITADKRHLAAKDGAVFEYDRQSHTLTVTIPSNGALNLTVNGGNVNLSAPNGDITLVTNSHDDSVNGIINTYNGHTHPDPQGGNTSRPTQQMS